VEVKPKNGYRFNVSTPATVPQKRSLKTSLDRSASHEGDGAVKKARMASVEEGGQGNEAPLRTTRIELRTNKPLKNSEDIHMDVWRIILTYSPLKFLLDAKTINHRFKILLDEESTVWAASRINQYSEDMPGPPGAMTEQRYAQLLEGRGCQSAGCSKRSTGKVYWAFCLRLCKDCLEKRTFKEEGVKQYILRDQAHYSLLPLLRAAVVDGGKYSRCRQISSATGTWEGSTAGALYLTSDVNAIVDEYEKLVQAGNDDAEISVWRDKKMDEVKALTLQIAAIEAWDKTRGVLPLRNREKRVTFFVEQAQLLNPPIREAALKKMLAYKMSLDSNTAPTQQTWEVLKRKIVPYREAAERLVFFEEQSNYTGEVGPHMPDLSEYDRLRKRRAALRHHGTFRALNHILNLGGIELTRWKRLEVNDADLALRVLNGVYQSYQRQPIQADIDEVDGTRGSSLLLHFYHSPVRALIHLCTGDHKLTLDDARTVFQDIIEPEVKSWVNPHRTVVALHSFKCAGCPRKDCNTRYSFVKGFEHIYDKHSKYVGEDTEFSMFAKPLPKFTAQEAFPWFTVPWPRNLPLVAAHHPVSRQDKWVPDADVPYIAARKPSAVSAFADRRAWDEQSIQASDFEGNLVFAAGKLSSTDLGTDCQTRIALQYALDRYATVNGVQKPSLKDFTASFKKIKEVNVKFDFRYRCGSCCRQTSIPRTTKFIKAPIHFHELEAHFEKKHENRDWTTDMMDLPSGEQLLDHMIEGDAALEREQAEVRDREESVKNSLRKKPCPKAQIILSKPASMSVFDTLYIKG
jgi:hypothetical protein